MKIGVLGAGQLGMMLAEAGVPLGMKFRFLDPAQDAPARGMGEHICADYDDPEALARFADGIDVVTWEFENVSRRAAQWLAGRLPIAPPPRALRMAGDRLYEKTLFVENDIPVPPFEAVAFRDELEEAAEVIGCPLVVKTRRFGYDGKGQAVLRGMEDLDAVWEAVGGVPLLAESLVAFDREVSFLAARSARGDFAFWPVVENHHRGGILRLSLAPAAGLPPAVEEAAREHARAILEALDYTGVLAIEFFLRGRELLANEMAPRVHNSGHWTIEGAATSQFENHLRAVAGLPLGPTGALGHCAMINIIGDATRAESLPEKPGRSVHLYGKAPREGRKLGHVTLVAASEGELGVLLRETAAALSDPLLDGILQKSSV